MSSCYRKANGTTIGDTSTVDGACSLITTSELVSPCCPIKSNNGAAGPNLCLSDYLCYEAGPPPGGSGFLTASCTDQTYASGECTQHCADNPVPDVIYNPSTGLWACCSWTYENGVDCANPTSETWVAPAPQALLNAASSSSSIMGTSTSSSASSTSTSAASSTTDASSSVSSSASTSLMTVTTATSSSPTSTGTESASGATIISSSNGLSGGAKAGIAVGVIAGVALLALAFFMVWRQGKRSRRRHVSERDTINPPVYHEAAGGDEAARKEGWTVDAPKYGDKKPSVTELHSTSRSELPAQGERRSVLAEMQ